MNSKWISGTVLSVFAAGIAAPATSHAQRQVTSLNPNAASNFGGATLNTGFTPDPKVYRMSAGVGGSRTDWAEVSALGYHDALTNEACSQAYITAAPDFHFTFSAGSFPLVRFYVIPDAADVDATMLINQPDGKWRCNDDHGKTNWGHQLAPSVDFANPPSGRFDIWVGVYSMSAHNPANLYVTELDSNHP